MKIPVKEFKLVPENPMAGQKLIRVQLVDKNHRPVHSMTMKGKDWGELPMAISHGGVVYARAGQTHELRGRYEGSVVYKESYKSNPSGEVRVVTHNDELGVYYTVQAGDEMISSHKTKELATAAARHVLAERSAHYVRPPQDNPVVRRGRTLIYSDIMYIVASKAGMPHNCDAECKRAKHIYKHKFKPGSCIWGLPNGNVEVGK